MTNTHPDYSVYNRFQQALEAYREDCRRCPLYPDGTLRPLFSTLSDVDQGTWLRNSTPREYKVQS